MKINSIERLRAAVKHPANASIEARFRELMDGCGFELASDDLHPNQIALAIGTWKQAALEDKLHAEGYFERQP